MSEIRKQEQVEPEQQDPKGTPSENPEPKIETELSPEVIEKIIAKVQDINEYGTAYSSISNAYTNDPEILESILKNGLLGRTADRDSGLSIYSNMPPEKWYARNVKRNQHGQTYFNIVGRTDFKGDEDPIPNTPEMNYCSMSRTRAINFIFDLSYFHEADLNFYRKLLKGEIDTQEELVKKHRYYCADLIQPGANDMTKRQFEESLKKLINLYYEKDPGKAEKVEDIKSPPVLGFVTKTRIPPKFFRGIIIGHASESLYKNEEEIATEEKRRLNLAITSMKKTYKDKLNLFIPIYSVNGDLLWPKQMSYEEVKKFIAERDAKKETEK